MRHDRAYIGLKIVLLAALFLVVSSCEGAMAHRGPEKPGPEKPGPEKPGPEKPGPEKPGPEKPTPGPGPEADGCAPLRQVDAKGVVVWVLPPECRYVAPPVAPRPRPTIAVVYPPVFRPMTIVPAVVQVPPAGPIPWQVIHGTPQVKSYSVGQPRPKARAIVTVKPIIKKGTPKKPAPQRRLVLPFGQ